MPLAQRNPKYIQKPGTLVHPNNTYFIYDVPTTVRNTKKKKKNNNNRNNKTRTKNYPKNNNKKRTKNFQKKKHFYFYDIKKKFSLLTHRLNKIVII